MQAAQSVVVTNGFRNPGLPVVPITPSPAIPDEAKVEEPTSDRKYLPHLLGRIYDYIEKKDDAVTRREVMDALEKEGYHAMTVNASFNTMKSLKILEVYTGVGTRDDPEQFWFCDGAVRPVGKPYKHIKRLTESEKKERDYQFAKKAAQQYTETQKRQINNTQKQIPAGTNNSIASEFQRLHVGETLTQSGSNEVRPLPTPLGNVTKVAVEGSGLAVNVPEALKNTEFKLSWRGQEISFEEAFKMKAELELITQMISSFSPK